MGPSGDFLDDVFAATGSALSVCVSDRARVCASVRVRARVCGAALRKDGLEERELPTLALSGLRSQPAFETMPPCIAYLALLRTPVRSLR